MRRDALVTTDERQGGNGVPVISEERWQEILVRSLGEVADRREQERRARAEREREERMRYAFD